MTDRTATRIATADGQTVTVISHTAAVTDWAARYFGSWWNAAPAKPPVTGPVVSADIDPGEYTALAEAVLGGDPGEADYAGSPIKYSRGDDGTVLAVQSAARLAYQWDSSIRRLRIDGSDETALATAAARLARELVRGMLVVDGWQILHASAVTRDDGATLLALGDKGAGKTTTAFLLARVGGWRLLANDRVFARVEDGRVRVLPWPSAAAFGFGLLDSLGLFEPVAARLRDGEAMHPTQDQRVTDALLEGRREPLWKANGKEMKPQFFPDQLDSWLGMPLATEGTAAGLLFPQITPGGEPGLTGEARRLGEADFFTAGTEDRYLDVFGLLPLTGGDPHLADRLAGLPHQSLALSHDTAASAALLEKTAAGLLG
ncbi:hypothetical protein [Streptomyces sp. AC602_WCS936]|uniref:hypothetical protein n=1 Tax=Streptomyces sp. AC602_WCS936 TaxID=2823685 RepID=UPI001C270B9B|nr:hypothetical protein [Streptomyces sp. AC602_WCS936]